MNCVAIGSLTACGSSCGSSWGLAGSSWGLAPGGLWKPITIDGDSRTLLQDPPAGRVHYK
jgi:hypothetical protein